MINVKELTDVELNRAMVWLYPSSSALIWADNGDKLYYLPSRPNRDTSWSYLQDWNLTMPLAVENRLWPQPAKAGTGWFCYDTGNKYSSYLNQNPLRAICEVLVQIKLEQKQ